MADTAIVYTPRDGSEKTVSLGTTPAVSLFAGQLQGVGARSVSHGGQAVTVNHDVFRQYDVERLAINPAAEPAVYAQLTAFLSEARAGVLFSFALSDAKNTATTTSGPEVEDSVIIGLADTTGMSIDDWLTFEDLDDPTQHEDARVQTVDSGVQITLRGYTKLRANYVSGSVVRHRDYFPLCLLDNFDFRERRAGQGAGIWDLRLRFRTVRG